MSTFQDTNAPANSRRPWNKGKLVGPKPPLQPKHVWAIRTRLQMQRKVRDLALFNLAIDSKLRGCDVVSLKVEDVAPHGYTMERATVRQKKTGRPVRFELTEQTRQAVDEYLRLAKRQPGSFLFGGRRGKERSLTTRQYARLVSTWVAMVGLDASVWDAFLAPHEGDADLPQDGKSQSGAAFAWPFEGRKHRALPWH